MAAIVSRNAYKAWEDNPILTTVSTTVSGNYSLSSCLENYSLLQAHPIHKLEYPAITICGQGMATDTLDKVLKQRFEVWLRKRNIDVDCRLPVLIEGHNKLSTPQRSVKISWLP